jgi:hypothetical protein
MALFTLLCPNTRSAIELAGLLPTAAKHLRVYLLANSSIATDRVPCCLLVNVCSAHLRDANGSTLTDEGKLGLSTQSPVSRAGCTHPPALRCSLCYMFGVLVSLYLR